MFLTEDELKLASHEQRVTLRRHWLKNYALNMSRVPSDYSVIDLPDLKFCVPVAVIGAAPISHETLEMLSEVRGLMTVCCDKALPNVLPYLKPAFVTALNTAHNETVELEKWFKDAPDDIGLIVPLTVHPRTTELWRGRVYWMNPDNIDDDLILRFEQETGIMRWHRGLNVGEFSVSMGAFMRPSEVDLFGIWYAWRTREEALSEFGPEPDSYNVAELVDRGERWWTTVSWLESRTELLNFCKKLYVQGVEIYNNSEGGIVYHEDYCKPQTPADFRAKWTDILQVPEVRERVAPDAEDGGDQ